MILYEMMRNGVKVASVITLDNGKCIVSWPTSTIVYDSEDIAVDVHIDHMGGRGEKTEFHCLWTSSKNIDRGMNDCIQDSCENVPFSSIGGLESRKSLTAPKYISENKIEYIEGYSKMARLMFGKNWRTCDFEWKKALTI